MSIHNQLHSVLKKIQAKQRKKNHVDQRCDILAMTYDQITLINQGY